MELPPVAESDDEPLPDLDQILQEKKAKDLKAKKLLLLQRQQQQQDAFKADDDDDDDLEVVDGPNISMQVAVKEEAEARKSGRPSLTASERILQKHAGISTSRRPTEVRSTTQARNPGELSMVLMRNVREDNARRSKEKGEEWVRRGGKPLDSEIPVTETRGIEWYAQQALDNAGKTKAETEEGGEEEDEDDEEWTPALRGSASPEPQELGSGDEDNENEGEEDQDVTMVAEEDASTQDEAPSRRSNRNVIGSDTEDENDENVRPQLGRVLVPDSMILDLPAPQVPHRQSDSSCDGATEDEGDKENNDRLMYDRGEDKENTAVVRYGLSSQGNSGTRPSLGPRQTSLLNLEEGLASRLSMSPGPGGYSTDEDKENPRSPLKTLSVTDIAPAPVPFAVRLQRSAQAITADENSEPLSPTFAPPISRQRQISGFSQFSDDGEGAQPKKLEAGFSDFFDSDTQKPSSSRPAFGTFKEPSQTNKFLAKLRRNDSLSLTQDIGLQPALEVDESLKRQADQVFEKEQEFLLDGANKSTNNEPELYINDQGFLTQTRPAGNAEVYRPNPAQSQAFSQQHASATQLSMTQTRTPFRELSTADLMEDLSEPSTRPRRLMKRRSPSPLSSAFPSNLERKRASTPSPLTNDIFKRPERVDRPRADKPRRRLEKSEFIEGEAQESDEDEMFGFRKAREADEEDGEDQDQTLETLVDDKAMDQTEIAEERVVEKYQEHLQADDARNEELANMAVGGQLRYGKRARDQAGIDDSDDDSEEDEKNRRIRRKMKEPELRGDIKSLAEHDATRAFAEHYRAGIRDDIDELAFLRDDSQDVVMTSMSHQDEEHADAQSDEEDDENYVTPGEIARQVRELAQNPEAERQTIDPYDTNFVDAGIDEDDDLPKFRVAKPNRDPRSARRAPVDQFDEDASQVRIDDR
ncbi:hypothetical protein GYMLUDRAFT_361030 [Collybiopsis luxurians FD-317 M1]|nr:hypothetical protein GYMLUDRAFT_361030 [Collybiopsis luxurians FD-317 M1]